jgi:hypothetical protein
MRLAAPLAAALAAATTAASLATATVAHAEPSLVEPARVAAAFAPTAPSLIEPAGPAPAGAAPPDAAAAVASAPPAPVAPAPARAPGSASAIAYLEPGVAIGGTSDGLYGAAHLDGGGRLVGPLWLHARLAQGDVAIINLAASSAPLLSSFTEARLGLELRGCRATGHLCLFGGVDAGYALQTLQRAGDMSTASDGPSVATATARLGLEVGGGALRLRTAIEAARGQGDWGTGGVTLGIARTW